MTSFAMRRLLASPPATGVQALPWATLAIVVPTVIRASLDDVVTGIAVMPFVPSVLLAAVFLGWRFAAVVALAGAAIADALFIGPPNEFLEGPTDIVAIALFLIVSAMIIVLVCEMRKMMARRPQIGHSPDAPIGIIFSLDGGEAWASWYGSGPPIRLGPQDEVAAMMGDFLAQLELGEQPATTYRQLSLMPARGRMQPFPVNLGERQE